MPSEYGAAGLVGILPPQANTTVEAELGVLLGRDIATIVSRLTCYEKDSRARLLGYFRNAADAVRAFDLVRPDIALFACTGSTYLVGLAEEEERFSRFPVRMVSAARAVLAALDALQARHIAVVSPYPEWLTQASLAFWRTQGREATDVKSPDGERDDTRDIYKLGSRQAMDALSALRLDGAQAVLITGTGMPSLAAIVQFASSMPVLSSNLCLGWAATRILAGAPLDADSLLAWVAPDAPWRARLAARFPKALR